MDAMEIAWGVDIEPVIGMVSAAFGKYRCSFFIVSWPVDMFYDLRSESIFVSLGK